MSNDREVYEAWYLKRYEQPPMQGWTMSWETWQAALASERAKQAEPVAWERAWSRNGETPKKERNENGRMAWPKRFKFLPVTKAKILPDDFPLYSAPPAVQAEPVKEQYEKECSDIDAILTHLGLDIEQCRTDGGRLNVPKIKTLLQQAQESHDRQAEPEWVVNSIAELGVKIGNRFFWMYKGRSLEYESGKNEDDGSQLYWRPIGKREFGECCRPVNYKDPTKRGTVSLDDSDDWLPLPDAAPPAVQAPKPELRWTGNYLQTTANRPTAVKAQMAQQAEPVAWAVMPLLNNGPALNSTHRKAEADSWREHGGNVVPLYAAPPADDEAVRLLREAREMLEDFVLGGIVDRIDAYLARVEK